MWWTYHAFGKIRDHGEDDADDETTAHVFLASTRCCLADERRKTQNPSSTHPFTHPSPHPSTHSTTHPPTHPSIHSSIHLPIHPSVHLPIHPPTHPSFHPSIPSSIHPFNHSSIHASIPTRIPSCALNELQRALIFLVKTTGNSDRAC